MAAPEQIWTIVVGGGSGRRFGAAKQYELLGDVRVIDRSVAVARGVCDGVVVVVPADDAEREGAVAGGATRSDSVRAGLAAVPDDATIICVHDAARPLASADLYRRVTRAIEDGADAAVPAVAVADTIKVVADDVVVSTPDRASLMAVQTPQAFRASALRAAHRAAGDATDDAALVERAGGKVVVVEGEITNRKITLPEDLEWARGRVSGTSAGAEMRVGQGFDIHRFSSDPDRVMVLGGCHFDGVVGLEGHSDADVVAHACADALLGAAGLGDIGQHFPDTDDRWRGADSMVLLRHVASMLAEDGWRASNVDCAVVCEQPKIAPYRAEMQRNLTSAVGAPVTVKGNRAEQLGAIGRAEGVVCFATALIHRWTP